jgi:arylsulfatase A-like enzyme
MWCKHTQFELDNHVPMILKVPGKKSAGIKTDALVEFVDIYPSLCELAGIEIPDHVQGKSFVPLVHNPSLKWKEGAFSYWPSVGRTDPDKLIMGYTIQTKRYRYTEWIKESSGELLARDLFDHQADPDENASIAQNPVNEALIEELSALLDRGKGWRQIEKKNSQ